MAVSNSKDGMLICDPLGYPRWFAYNYGIQFVVLPDRVLQFFELGPHVARHLDRRPEAARRSAAAAMAGLRRRPVGRRHVRRRVQRLRRPVLDPGGSARSALGFPHSDQMRIVERYRRTSYGTLDAELTIIDPVVYTKPWTTKAHDSAQPGYRALGIPLRDVGVGGLQRAEKLKAAGRRAR